MIPDLIVMLVSVVVFSSWKATTTKNERRRVRPHYRSLQVLHQYFVQETKSLFPSNVTLIVALVNLFLYRFIAYYKTVHELPIISPLIVFVFGVYTFLLKMCADGADGA